MSIKESALSVISAIAQSDFVRAVTSDGNSRRVTVANLAKAIVESYTGSSLGGSQRSVKSAIDSLNSKTEAVTKFLKWNNTGTFSITLPTTPSNSHYGQLTLFNANQRVLCMIKVETSLGVYMVSNTSITITASISGTTLTITPSATLWGATLGILQF